MGRTATTKDVAEALGVRPTTVQKYAREGLIPCARTPGGHHRFDVGEVLAALESRPKARVSAEILRAYRGRWVIEHDGHVLFSADTPIEVFEWARQQAGDEPVGVVFEVPSGDEPLVPTAW